MIESDTGAVIRVLHHAPSGGWVDAAHLDRRGGDVLFGSRSGNSHQRCTTQLHRVPLDGSPGAVIGEGVQPALSPDGTMLAYAASLWDRTRTAPPNAGGIGCALSVVVIRDLVTGAERIITPPRFDPSQPKSGSWELHAVSLKWSPDQRRIAYTLSYEGGTAIVADVATAIAQPVEIAPELMQMLREHYKGGYPELAASRWTPQGHLELMTLCYACFIPSVRVIADDGYTANRATDAASPPLDASGGHELIVHQPQPDQAPVLARRAGTNDAVTLRADTTQAQWL